MRTIAIATGLLAVALSTPAEAKRGRGDEIAKLRAEIQAMKRDIAAMQRKASAPQPSFILESILRYPPEGIGRLLPAPVAIIPPPVPAEQPRTIATYRDHLPGVSMKGAPEPLQEWMRKVAAACTGFRAISVCRPGARVAGSGRTSLHASCRAVDFQVSSPSCAWEVLNRKGDRFPGGMSNDYARVKHFHVSWAKGSGEWSARFAHGGGKRYYAKKKWRTRYAARHRSRG